MRIHVHEMYYPDDEGPYAEEVEAWVYDDVIGILRQNGKKLEQAFQSKYPGAKVSEVSTDIQDPSYTRGKDWSEISATVQYKVLVTVPDAEPDDDDVDALLEAVPTERGKYRQLSDLEWECLSMDMADGKTVLECELFGAYDNEDSAY